MFGLIKKTFSLDLRSLALFRVCVAVILLVDFLFTRLPYFDLFYTDKGLLPVKRLLSSGTFWSSTSSLNFISSSYFYQLGLFILALVFFCLLLIGYKTRLALFGSWVLLASFQSRNFLILNSGDVLFLLMLFWALRLPLAEYFAIDSVFKKVKKNKAVFSFNSVAFIFQILFVYYFTYLLKTDPIWKSGQGVYYALMLDNFRTVWGDILLQYPQLMKVLSIITYHIIESLVPFAFICLGFWWRFRVFLILVMCGFHLSLGLFLHLGCFSWICMAGWLVFLPAEFWDTLSKWFSRAQSPLTVYYDGACSFCEKAVFLIKEFFILPSTVSFKTAKSNNKAFLEMEKRNSWLVLEQARWYDRWQVFVKLVSYSPLLFWLAPLLRWKRCSKWGDKLYGVVAKNRQKLGPYLKWVKVPEGLAQIFEQKAEVGHFVSAEANFAKQSEKKQEVLSSPTRQGESLPSIFKGVFFFVCFIYVIMWNVRTLDFNYYSKFMPKSWNGFGAFFHLHQHWSMFAPKPLDTTGWLILSATPVVKMEKKPEDTVPVSEGGLIDLWQGGEPLNWDKPNRYDMTFPVFRIRKMMENLVLKHKRESKGYLKWLCRQWNKKEKRIKRIELIYMKQKVPPYGQALPEPKKTSIRHITCP